MPLRVLSWNLFHGRSLPASREGLLDAFQRMLAGWEWDVAMLQEVPPWWPERLADACAAEERTVLTSRNSLLAVRAILAARRPKLMKSNGGGSNAVLSRSPISEHRALRLRRRPERRVAQLVRLRCGVCVANFHGSTRVPLAREELERLWDRALAWAGADPLVLAGDLNLRAPLSPLGAAHLAERDVDHVFAVRLRADGQARVLERRVRLGARTVELSDHPPLLVRVRREAHL